jgi:hypothetical protein
VDALTPTIDNAMTSRTSLSPIFTFERETCAGRLLDVTGAVSAKLGRRA